MFGGMERITREGERERDSRVVFDSAWAGRPVSKAASLNWAPVHPSHVVSRC